MNDELAQVEAALRRLRRKEADARRPGGRYNALYCYTSLGQKPAVDPIAAELLDRHGAREYARGEVATVIEERAALPAPDAELVARATRLGAVQRDILRAIAQHHATRYSDGFESSDIGYRPQQPGGKRDQRIAELREQSETVAQSQEQRAAELRRLTRREAAARRARDWDFSGKAGVYHVGDREMPKADFLRAAKRLEAMGLASRSPLPAPGARDRSYCFGLEVRNRHSFDPAKREREYAWTLTDEGELVAYATLYAEPQHPGLLWEFSCSLGRRQEDRLGIDRYAPCSGLRSHGADVLAAMVRHAAERIALERRAAALRARARACSTTVAENAALSI
jgi:hypothetical protein